MAALIWSHLLCLCKSVHQHVTFTRTAPSVLPHMYRCTVLVPQGVLTGIVPWRCARKFFATRLRCGGGGVTGEKRYRKNGTAICHENVGAFCASSMCGSVH